MAKKKSTTGSTAGQLEPSKPGASPLTDLERLRAEHVLSSQGRPIGLLDCFPLAMQKALADYCDPASGSIKAGVSEGVAELIANFFADQKAEVDDEKKKPQGFGQPAEAPTPEAGQPQE